MSDTDSNLPPGATTVPRAGRPADAPGVAAERELAQGETKRDANAAAALPDLYRRLNDANAMLNRATAGPVNLHTVNANIGGDEFTHSPTDKAAWNDFLKSDLQKTVDDLKKKITALGFDPGG